MKLPLLLLTLCLASPVFAQGRHETENRQRSDSIMTVRKNLYRYLAGTRYVVYLEPSGWAKIQWIDENGNIMTLSLTPEESEAFYREMQRGKAIANGKKK